MRKMDMLIKRKRKKRALRKQWNLHMNDTDAELIPAELTAQLHKCVISMRSKWLCMCVCVAMRAKHVNSKQEQRNNKNRFELQCRNANITQINSQVRCNVYIRLMISILLKRKTRKEKRVKHLESHAYNNSVLLSMYLRERKIHVSRRPPTSGAHIHW